MGSTPAKTMEKTMAVSQPAAASKRGACPALSAPMVTGDGLLVRLRPAGGALSLIQFGALAEAAGSYGNGIIEITARGNLQIRGLRPETVPQLASAVDAAGIIVPEGPAIEISPFHGIDPSAQGDAAAMEAALRNALRDILLAPALAPKLSIVVDDGGEFSLAALSADIRLTAETGGNWLVAVGGDASTAFSVLLGSEKEAIGAVRKILEILISLGHHQRGRDIGPERLRAEFPDIDSIRSTSVKVSKTLPTGSHRCAGGANVFGVRPEFGHMRATDLIAFLDHIGAESAGDIRLAPARGFFVTGLTHEAMPAMEAIAGRYGFNASRATEYIAACAGEGACASGFYETRTLARKIRQAAPGLLDGSLTLHLSGCAKGCAHPKAALTLTGSPEGYALILNGRASDMPDQRIAGERIDFAIEKLARCIEAERAAGESTAACLKRLGAEHIRQALRQE